MATLWTRQPRRTDVRTAREAASEVGRWRPRARSKSRESERCRRRRVKLLCVVRPQRLQQRRAQYERSAHRSGSDLGARFRERSRARAKPLPGGLVRPTTNRRRGKSRTSNSVEQEGAEGGLRRDGEGERERRTEGPSMETPLAVQTLVVSGSRNNRGEWSAVVGASSPSES